jgi:hypothetical protein
VACIRVNLIAIRCSIGMRTIYDQQVAKRGFRQCDDAGLEVNEISQVAAGPQPEPASSAQVSEGPTSVKVLDA